MKLGFATIVVLAGLVGAGAALAQRVAANGPGAADARSDNPALQHEDKGGSTIQKNGAERDNLPDRNKNGQE